MARKRVACMSADRSGAGLTLIHTPIICSCERYDSSSLTAQEILLIVEILILFLQFDRVWDLRGIHADTRPADGWTRRMWRRGNVVCGLDERSVRALRIVLGLWLWPMDRI